MLFSIEYGISRKKITYDEPISWEQIKRGIISYFEIDAEVDDILVQEWDANFADYYDIHETPPDQSKLKVVVRSLPPNSTINDTVRPVVAGTSGTAIQSSMSGEESSLHQDADQEDPVSITMPEKVKRTARYVFLIPNSSI